MTKHLQRRPTGHGGWLEHSFLGIAAAFVAAALPAAAQPANDDFASAQVIAGISGTVAGDTTFASRQAGEPPHAGAGGASVWFRWTATNSGYVTFDTVGSSFDTVLAVYRGTNVASLSKVTDNDDISAGVTSSRVSFAILSGNMYYIAVDGYNPAGPDTGPFTLNWQPGNVPVSAPAAPGVIEFSASSYSVTEFESSFGPYGPAFPSFIGRSTFGAVITMIRTGNTSGRVQVDYSADTADPMTVVPFTDFFPVSGTMVLDDFQTSARFLVPVGSDAMSNGNKSVTLTLLNPALAPGEDPGIPAPVLGFNSAAALNIIEINRGTVTNFNFERATHMVQEDEGPALVDVVLTRPVAAATEVDVLILSPGFGFAGMDGSDYAIPAAQTFPNPIYTDGTANLVDQADYVAATVRLAFAAGQTRATVPVTINNDNQVEFNEDILLVLRPVAGSPGIGAQGSTLVTIMDEDIPAGALDPEWNPDFVGVTVPRYNATPGANNIVRALVIQADQKTVIGGDFTAYNSVPCGSIARVNVNGSNDGTFVPGTGADGFVTSLALYVGTGTVNDGKIVVGGGFSSFNNIQRNGVARLDSDGSLDSSFSVGAGANGVVWSVAVQADGKVLVAGEFTRFNGLDRNGVVRLNLNGSIDTTFDPGAGADGTIWSIAASGSGIFIGGEFLNFDGVYRGGVARLLAGGGLDLSYDPGGGANGPVYCVLPQTDGRLLVGGSFSTFDFRSRGNLARLDGAGALDVTYDPGSGANDTVYCLALQSDGKAMVGGLFRSFNGTRRMGLTRLFVNGKVDTSFLDTAYNQYAGLINTYAITPPNYVNAVGVQTDGNVMIGGSFTNVGGNFSTRLDSGDYLSGSWNRAEKRPRYNLARLVGGYTLGPGNIEYSAGSYTIDENAGNLNVSLRRTDGRLGTILAQAATRDNIALGGVDFGDRKRNVGWPEFAFFAPVSVGYSGERIFSVSIINDLAVEGDEPFKLVFQNPQGTITLGGEVIPVGAALGRTEAVATIVDNDFNHGSLVFGSSLFATNEDAGSLKVTVIRTNGSSGPVSVSYYTRSGTAASGQDFTGTTLRTLFFGSGVTSQTISIPLVNDSLVEPDETFFIVLTNATGGAIVPGGSVTTTCLIIDDDFLPGRITFAATNFAVIESVGSAPVTLWRRGGSFGQLDVTVTSSAGTATDGVDFFSGSTNLTWVDGDVAPKIFYVPVVDDLTVEGQETILMAISNPSVPGSIGTISNATVTITDNDFLGKLSFSQAIYDADERGTNVTITVVRTGGSGGTVTANYVVNSGTAVSNVDWSAGTGTLTFAPGVTATNFEITILNNLLTDGERRATLRLTNFSPGVNVRGAIPLATLRIFDDESVGDPAGTVDTAYNPLAGGTNAIHTLALQPDGKLLVGGEFRTLNRVLRNRIGRLNEDGTLDDTFDPQQGPNAGVRAVALQADGRVLIGGFFTAVGPTNRAHIARLLADGTVDRAFDPGAGADNPVFAVGLDSNARVFIGGSFATVDGISRSGIAALDPDGGVSSSFDPGQGANGTVFAVAVQNDGKILVGGSFTQFNGVAQPYLVRLNIDGSVDGTFTTGTGPSGAVRAIALQPDGRVLIGGSFTNYNGLSRGHLARLMADGTIDVSFLTSVQGANSDVTGIALQFDLEIVVVGDFSTFNGVSRNRITRLNRNGKTDPTINFGDGANESVNAVVIQPDRKIVIGGRFTTYDTQPRFFLARIYGGSIAGPGSVEFSSPIYSVVENAGQATITVLRRGGTTGDITVDYFSGSGTATPGADYTSVGSTLTFPEGETRQTFAVPIVNDFIGEPTETVGLFLTNQTAGVTLGAVPQATLLIINDDSSVGFSSGTYTVSEGVGGGNLLINVLRTGATNGITTVNFATVDGTARAGRDYVARSGVLTFNPGDTIQSFAVPIIDDTLIEPSETFGLILSNLTGTAALGIGSATVTILDNDFRAGTLTFSAATYSISEIGGLLTLTVLRTNGTTGVVSVDYATSPGTATAGVDYLSASGTLTFVDGQTSNTLVVTILDDAIVEGDETFSVTLSNPGGGAGLGGVTNATVTIVDEETGPGSLDRTFDPGAGANDFVRSVAVQPDGKILAGGAFTRFGGTNRTYVVRLQPDGSVDVSFNATNGPNGLIASLASTADNRAVLGGNFTAVTGVPFNHAARLLTDGTADLNFQQNAGFNGSVNVTALEPDGRILMGGAFSLPTRGIVQLRLDGSVDTVFNPGIGVDGPVHAIALQPDGRVVIGGAFSTTDGSPRSRVARLNPDGSLDGGFVPVAITNGTVYSIVVQSNGLVVLGGDFVTTAGTNRVQLARLNTDGSLDSSFAVGTGANGIVFALGLNSFDQIMVGGTFTSINGTNRNRFARLNTTGGLDAGFDPGPGANGTVYSLAMLPADAMIIGGDFTTVNGTPRNRVAKILGGGPAATGFATAASFEAGELRLAVTTSAGNVCVLEATSDLHVWTPVATNLAVSAVCVFTQKSIAGVPARFYRVRQFSPGR